MSSYLNEIEAFIPDMKLYAERKQAERLRSEAEREYLETSGANYQYQIEKESRQYGALALAMLTEYGVSDISCISRRKSGYVHEIGRGWHVATRIWHEYDYRHVNRIGLDSNGGVVLFESTKAKGSDGIEYTGMVNAERIKNRDKLHAVVTSDYFAKGISSLIEGCGFYIHDEFDQPATSYEDLTQPPLPGM